MKDDKGNAVVVAHAGLLRVPILPVVDGLAEKGEHDRVVERVCVGSRQKELGRGIHAVIRQSRLGQVLVPHLLWRPFTGNDERHGAIKGADAHRAHWAYVRHGRYGRYGRHRARCVGQSSRRLDAHLDAHESMPLVERADRVEAIRSPFVALFNAVLGASTSNMPAPLKIGIVCHACFALLDDAAKLAFNSHLN
jgi:hypothetical protein